MTKRRKIPRIPFFHPIPVKARRDGWTADRQCAFIGHLAVTRCVASAARAVGMARETAYRLRNRPGAEGFARAWDIAMACPDKVARGKIVLPPQPRISKVTAAHHHIQWMGSLHRPVIYRGEYRGVQRKADFSGLLRLVKRLPGKRVMRVLAASEPTKTGREIFTAKRKKRSTSLPFPPTPGRATLPRNDI